MSATDWKKGDRLEEAYTGQTFTLAEKGVTCSYVWAHHPCSGTKLWRTDQFRNIDAERRTRVETFAGPSS